MKAIIAAALRLEHCQFTIQGSEKLTGAWRTSSSPAAVGAAARSLRAFLALSLDSLGGPMDSVHVTRPRALLADDHTLVLEAFEKLLADECDVIGAVTDGHALVEAAGRLHPDLAVIDVGMPRLNGIDAARRLKREDPALRIVILTMNEDPDLAAEAFRAGASGYLLKRSAASELRTAVQTIMKGHSYLTPLATEAVVDLMLDRPDAPPRAEPLTARQSEVVQLIAEGRSMKEVAALLEITPRTVAFHKYQVMAQLRIKTTAELIQYAVKRHMV
jgi:DNA-binding NarL/FixJ family response regulator